MSKRLQIREVVHGSADYWAMVRVREAVLRTPLGLRFTEQELAQETTQIHLTALCNDEVVGTLLMVPFAQGEMKLRQMAVSPEHQGRGIGSQLLRSAEAHAVASGCRHCVLHARQSAQPFYELHGYQAVGEPFEEVTLLHVMMIKTLSI